MLISDKKHTIVLKYIRKEKENNERYKKNKSNLKKIQKTKKNANEKDIKCKTENKIKIVK